MDSIVFQISREIHRNDQSENIKSGGEILFQHHRIRRSNEVNWLFVHVKEAENSNFKGDIYFGSNQKEYETYFWIISIGVCAAILFESMTSVTIIIYSMVSSDHIANKLNMEKKYMEAWKKNNNNDNSNNN